MAVGFTFRLKFTRSARSTINGEGVEWTFQDPLGERPLLITSSQKGGLVSESQQLVLKADGWPTAESADAAGKRCRDALALSLARLRIGADFGRRASKSGFTNAGLAWLQQKFGVERVLSDSFGLMVFESNPKPRFASTSAALQRGIPKDQFELVFSAALQRNLRVDERQALSIDLFGASTFQQTADARLLLLIMAVEALLEPIDRSEASVSHVEELIGLTKRSESLSYDEKNSLIGSLRWLRKESISRTARNLVSDRLGLRPYMGMAASDFFSLCYGIRSSLVHGRMSLSQIPDLETKAVNLEVLVSDLLSAPLLDVGPGR